MDKYLLEILKLVNTIIIPGLGALTITNKETGEIMFMPYLKHDDGKLSAHIAEKEGWDENEAKNLIAKYVREIQADLDQGEEYTMYQFGSFVKVDGDIEFKNWKKPTGKVENEYIPPVVEKEVEQEPTKENPKVVELKEDPVEKLEEKVAEEKSTPIIPIIPKEVNSTEIKKELNIEEKEEQEATVAKLVSLQEIQDKKEKKKKKGAGFWIGIAMLSILLIGGAYVGLNYDSVKQHLPFLADNSVTETEEGEDVEESTPLEESDIIDEQLSETSDDDSLEDEISEEVTEENDAEISPEEIIEEEVALSNNTSFSSELPYQIIAGAFSEEANATRLVEKLKGEDYPALQMKRGSKYMVSVKSFATRADAQAELAAIKKVASGGWITKW